jgi:pyrimidine operon attenuation protein/uracil phosphoribosyltransferase
MTDGPGTRPLLSHNAVQVVFSRMAHEIAEDILPGEDLVVIGIQRGGVIASARIAKQLSELWNHDVPRGLLDVSLHRDDHGSRAAPGVHATDMPFDIHDKRVLLVDDVVYSGRTIRAALDTLSGYGRPQRIQLAAVVDRGGRQLPIRADFIGKEVSVPAGYRVNVDLDEAQRNESVFLELEPE